MTNSESVETRTRKAFHRIHEAHLREREIKDRHTGLIQLDRMNLPQDFLVGKMCADLGCGSAVHGTVNMLEQGATYVNAIDLDETFLSTASQRLQETPSFKGRYKLDIGSVLNLPYESEAFDFVNCAGVIHHTTDDLKAATEIYRVMKRGGKGYLSVTGGGGIINRLFMEVIRDEYRKNKELQNVVQTGQLAHWLQEQTADLIRRLDEDESQEASSAARTLLDSLASLIDEDLALSIADVVEAPIYKTYDEAQFFDLLRKSGFNVFYRFSKRPRYKNVRQIFAPLYEDFNHPLAKLLYNDGSMNVVVTK